MKTNQILRLILLSIIFSLSACSVSHTSDGTYEGILPAADCPGIYVMLTIDENKYELLEKYLTLPETFVTYGEIKRQGQTLQLDNQMEFTCDSNHLSYKDMSLRQISTQKSLPEIFISQSLKENQTGEDALLKVYSRKGKQFADLYFRDNKYSLEESSQNDSTKEYTDTKKAIKLSIPVSRSSSLQELTFKNDTAAYTFTSLTPCNNIYRITEKEEHVLPAVLDVIYYNDGQQAFVKLLHSTLSYCYTLPQTEASAKTAIYTDGQTEWQLLNHRNAVLIINHQKYEYMEE